MNIKIFSDSPNAISRTAKVYFQLEHAQPGEIDSHQNRIEVEQLRLVLKNTPGGAVASCLLAALITFGLDRSAALWWWFAVSIAVPACIITVVLRQHLTSTQQVAKVKCFLVIMFSAMGVIWGVLPWIAFDPNDIASSALILCAMVGMTGAALPMMAPFERCYHALLLGATIPFALFFLQQNDIAFIALGLSGILYAIVMAYFSHHAHQTTKKAIQLGYENVDLVEKLQQESVVVQAARDDAQIANMAKSKFLAAASHDLRQPIHAQSLFLEVLQRSGSLNKRQQQALSSAIAATLATRDMLNTLLDFSRIEAGVLQPQIRTFHLQAMLDKIKDEMLPQAKSKGLIYRSRNTPHIVSSDPAMVELILRNLISNAIRYTDNGGLLVGCRLHQLGAQLYVSVEVWDSGCGIAKENQREVFREFHQLGNHERDQSKGLGLGLAIAKGLAIGLAHRLNLSSRLGRGSVFSLSLPLATTDDILMDEESAIAEEGMGMALGKNLARLKNLRVLIIEDDKAVREAMVQLLKSWGCDCAAVEYIEEALVEAQSHQPQFIVSDYRLREHSTGTEAITALRAAIGEGIPALLITGDTAPERLREAQASGVPVLHKPVLPDVLQQTILKLLA